MRYPKISQMLGILLLLLGGSGALAQEADEQQPVERPAAKKKSSKKQAPRTPAAEKEAEAAPADQERLNELEARVAELELKLKEKKSQKEPAAAKDGQKVEPPKAILSLGGFQFRLGGEIRIDLVDPQNEKDPVFGSTESPDPHFDFNKLRITPWVDFPRSETLGEVRLRSEIDFHPTAGDTILKRATVGHEVQPAWWFRSQAKVGLDDPFIRPARLTQNYPLVGTAFWRDQTMAFFWEGRIGDKRGMPPEPGEEEQPEPKKVPARSAQTSSTSYEPFDFSRNCGALKLHFSAGNGYQLNNKEIGRDDAPFDQLLQDDRDLDAPLALREIGIGAGYERDFRELGEIEILGFYYNDELSDESVQFLQTYLTERDPITLAPIRGYGDSTSKKRDRIGLNAGYHFEAYHLYESLGLNDVLFPRKGDGLYLFYQWIAGTDGDLDRTGWYAQASYRFSNPYRWKYFKSIEPVIRYGELSLDQDHIPSLPLTWNRRQWLVGALFEIVKDVYIRAEYTFNKESTGAGNVSNNELLIQLLAKF